MTPEEALGIKQSEIVETLQSIDSTLKRIEEVLNKHLLSRAAPEEMSIALSNAITNRSQ